MGTNTGIGIGIGIPFKNNALGGDRPYLPPELKAKLIGVWDNYGKKNTDADRNIIKNKIPNAGGDLEILNAAYEGMSGYNGYPVVFGRNKTWTYASASEDNGYIYTSDSIKYNIKQIIFSTALCYSYIKQNGEITSRNKDVESFKIKVTGLEATKFILKYRYIDSADAINASVFSIISDGTYELPKSVVSNGNIEDFTWIGFNFTKQSTDIPNIVTDVNITIEILPEYEGAFVTDGVNDMIVSQNPVSEMLDESKELTVVSMMCQISDTSDSVNRNNWLFTPTSYLESKIEKGKTGKTGIYGYTSTDIRNGQISNVNTILGDKNDYIANSLLDSTGLDYFSVEGFNNQGIWYTSSVAWYWTFIAKRALTTDEINQVIAYYNLDKYVKPDIYYNVKKQGLTNDNHAQFGDKLIDYSGNSRDLQLFNIGWNPGSGIGKYVTNFGIWSKDAESKISYNSYSFTVNGSLKRTWLMWYVTELPSFKIKVSGINSNGYVDYGYYDNGSLKNFRLDKDGIHTLPPSGASSNGHGFKVNDTSLDWTGLVIEQIPDFAGALCFDGVDDYGQFVGDLGLKDYTVIFDRAYPIVSTPQFTATSDATDENANTPFLIEHRDVNANEFTYSYLANNAISINKEREICYQSTYQYKDTVINKGSSTSLGTGLTIARYGINNGYSALALYSFMLFHYSMSKFLIERQLKKHKLGTLYPNMVEFRPIIKSNIDILKINYWDKDSNVVKAGDYISIGSNIKTSITVLDGYKISKVSSTAFNNITIEKSNTDFIYDVIFYGIKKSPQKINLVIEQDSDYVQWNPNIKANVSKYSVTANIRKTDGTTLKLVNGQFYSTSIIGNLVLDIVPPYKDSDEVTNVVIDGKSYTPTKDSSGNYYRLEIPLVFPKEINITIQEYVRYEDIVQPYPVLLRFKDENNNEISWGDKIKLGSSITRIGSFNDCNLLKDIYTVSNAKLNGSPLPSTPHVVERQMVFTCTATWIFDNNEPKCVLSPDRLQIPNSSYRILKHIPDISGHGNHGKINNSAYAEMSGVNGYPYDYKNGFMAYSNCRLVDSETFNVIFISPTINIIKNTPTYKGKIKVTGLSGYLKLRIYPKDDSTNAIEILEDGVYDINIDNETDNVYFHVVKIKEGSNDINVIIQQVGEYEGAYCLDGINDFVTIPTLSKGGKQVLMKVNWQKQDTMLYNQNPGQDNFAIFTNDYNNNNLVVAYASRNNGNTYIDGVINNNILATQLKGITHNIVATNNNIDATIAPIIGSNKNHDNFFAQMSLYDFMLFDEISTDDKIKELNTYIGITPKVTLPNYYWDNYGKKNTDAKRGYIDEQVSLQNTGTSVNPLENFNIGYEGMSGYNGYPVVFGANKTWETSNAIDYIYDINSTIVHITNVKHAANGLLYSYVKRDGALANIKEIPAFRVTVKGLEENSKLIYKYLATENATKESIVYLGNGTHKLPKSFVPTDALLDLTTNSWIGFAITPMIEGELVFDCDITIEILPEYENGLVYDGVSDFTYNKNIPIFTDFTAIIKRVDLDAKNNNSTVMFKGNKIYESGIGNGFILDYCYNSRNYVYNYGKLNQIERDDSKIIYLTPESYNGNPIIKGENRDNLGLALGDYWKGIIYKTILYSKTISLLEINFLKNLIEKDEIIDINHPIFISNTEDESNTSQDT